MRVTSAVGSLDLLICRYEKELADAFPEVQASLLKLGDLVFEIYVCSFGGRSIVVEKSKVRALL